MVLNTEVETEVEVETTPDTTTVHTDDPYKVNQPKIQPAPKN